MTKKWANGRHGQRTSEWDVLASVRFDQIASGTDLTYNRFILPNLVSLTPPVKSIIDVGCGVGLTTKVFSVMAEAIIGIDPSHASIAKCREKFPDLTFFSSTAEDFDKSSQFDLVILNMVLHNTSDIKGFLAAIRQMMHSNSLAIFSICHPRNWPKYKKLDRDADFDYHNVKHYRIPFTISHDRNNLAETSYYHRPWELYVKEFNAAGFRLKEILEPMPDSSLMTMYPETWSYPRYMFGKLVLA